MRNLRYLSTAARTGASSSPLAPFPFAHSHHESSERTRGERIASPPTPHVPSAFCSRTSQRTVGAHAFTRLARSSAMWTAMPTMPSVAYDAVSNGQGPPTGGVIMQLADEQLAPSRR